MGRMNAYRNLTEALEGMEMDGWYLLFSSPIYLQFGIPCGRCPYTERTVTIYREAPGSWDWEEDEPHVCS